MNDNLLHKLKQRAGIDDNPDQEGLDIFAELILQECFQVLKKWKGEPFPFDEDLAVSLIKEQFGVKE